MAYERQYYTNGDVLNAEQLNHMEAGIKENSDSVSKLSEEIANGVSGYQNYSKYKAVFLGDSQTATTSAKTKIWWEWVKELLNLGKCVNYGLSGSPLCGTGSNSMCTRYASMDDDATMVFVMGGVNDFKTAVSTALGTIADTTPDTMYGAVRYLCQKLQAKYPKTPIIFITPTNQTNGAFVHAEGVTMADLAKAMRDACRTEGILCLDAQASLGINPAYDQSYTTDRLHLNDVGQELLGKWVARQVNSNVPILSTMTSGDTGDDSGSGGEETEKTLTGISAIYSGGDVTVGTSVNDLTGITVKATYSDGSIANVTGYTLSGTIAEGSNTITVSYGGKTTTFTVTGVAESGSEEEIIVYSVTNNLTNVNSNNASVSISSNESYTSTLTASDGYVIIGVTVTMGGVDITSEVYASGIVTITTVTGDIVITASAIVKGETYLYAKDYNVTMGKYLSKNGSVGDGVAYGYTVDYMPCIEGDVWVKGDVGIAVVFYDNEYNVIEGFTHSVTSGNFVETKFTAPTGTAYARMNVTKASYESDNTQYYIRMIVD